MKKTRFLFATLIMILSSCGDGSSQKTYTVTWKNWDGSTLEVDRNIKEGSYPSYDGYTPIRSGDSQYYYSFSGWSPSLRAVSSDITYTAQFSRNTQKYTVTWKNWNGNVLETDRDVPYGTTPTYNGTTPTRDSDGQYNYTFSGWSPAISSVTQNATYTAQFNKTENYECDNVYHWKNISDKTSHSYSITEQVDSNGYITLECDVCHHIVRERATCRYGIDSNGLIWIQDFYNYIDGTKDFVVPPLVVNTPTSYFGTLQSDGVGNSYFINSNPFSTYLKEVENIWLPPTFKQGSFHGLKKLKQINIQDTQCVSIGWYVNLLGGFQNCESLSRIELPSTLKLAPTSQYESSDNYTRSLFYSCKSLKSVVFNSTVKTLAANCFSGCTSLEEYRIPSSVTTLSFRVFGRIEYGEDIDVYKLSKLYIPKSVTSISSNAIIGCDNLTIYCEASSKPSGWNDNWNPDGRPVVWNYTM